MHHKNYCYRAFTLIELMIVIAIISILATIILVMLSPKPKARINGAKTSLHTALPAIIACIDGGSSVSLTDGLPVSGTAVCTSATAGLTGAKWPVLPSSYAYKTGNYNSSSCIFSVSTNSDSADLTCSCLTQICQ